MNLSRFRTVAIVAALVILAGGVGYDLGRRKIAVSWSRYKPFISIKNQAPPAGKDIDFGLFWEVWQRLERDYIDKDSLKPQEMVWGAIKGMVASVGDPYTVFLPPKENRRAKEDLAGSFEGIGAQLGMRNKRIIVVAPLKGMPAEKAGLKAGDYILKVDGKDTTNWTLPEAVNNIRGPKGTKVVLTVGREGGNKPLDISIVRGTIKVPSLEVELGGAKCTNRSAAKKPNNEQVCQIVKLDKCTACKPVALLRLYRFGDHTNGEWEDAVLQINNFRAKLKSEGKTFSGVIFDLRNNPGGYLNGAVYVASEFLSSGVVVQQRMKNGSVQKFTVNREGRLTDVPLVVVVNQGSASASEIVAGALKDHQRAVLVGVKTFGKGSVQEAQDLPGGAGLHITTAKWLLPNGQSIDQNGIEPDLIVENELANPANDRQLTRAIKALLKE